MKPSEALIEGQEIAQRSAVLSVASCLLSALGLGLLFYVNFLEPKTSPEFIVSGLAIILILTMLASVQAKYSIVPVFALFLPAAAHYLAGHVEKSVLAGGLILAWLALMLLDVRIRTQQGNPANLAKIMLLPLALCGLVVALRISIQ